MNRLSQNALLALITAISVTAPAYAGLSATPVPVLGLGIPALVAFGYAYRRLNKNNKD